MKKEDVKKILALIFICCQVTLLIILLRTAWFGFSLFGFKVLLTDLLIIFSTVFIAYYGFNEKDN